jgi:hypothetical protein
MAASDQEAPRALVAADALSPACAQAQAPSEYFECSDARASIGDRWRPVEVPVAGNVFKRGIWSNKCGELGRDSVGPAGSAARLSSGLGLSGPGPAAEPCPALPGAAYCSTVSCGTQCASPGGSAGVGAGAACSQRQQGTKHEASDQMAWIVRGSCAGDAELQRLQATVYRQEVSIWPIEAFHTPTSVHY